MEQEQNIETPKPTFVRRLWNWIWRNKWWIAILIIILVLLCWWLCPFAKSKKKEYRPYTIEEFCNEGFEIVVFREKEDHSREYHVRYNGYRKAGTEYIILGSWSYTLNDLFNDFEYLDNDGNWKPFGVEE